MTVGVDSLPTELLAVTTALEDPTLSPDGAWVAYTEFVGGTPQVFVRPFPDVDAQLQRISTRNGMDPRWSDDGAQLFFSEDTQLGSRIMAAHVRGRPTFVVDSIEPLFDWLEGGFAHTDGWFWEPMPDGSRFLVVRQRREPPRVTGFVLVENLAEELRSKVGNE